MLLVLRRHFPLTVMGSTTGASPEEHWAAIGPAFATRMMRTAEAMKSLVPLNSRLDGMTLARSLLDHTITFAWIAVDPDARLDVWLRHDFRKRLDFDRKAKQRGDATRWPFEPLPEADSAHYREFVRRPIADLPGLPKMAAQADAHWLPRYPGELAGQRAVSMESLYEDVYDLYSWQSHPTTVGLRQTWEVRSQYVLFRGEDARGRDHDPLHMGQLLFGVATLLVSLSLGWPSADEVLETLNGNGVLAKSQREGRLRVSADEGGRYTLWIADA
jgi:hypothetical protein